MIDARAEKSKIENVARWGHNLEQLDELDAWSSEWNECKKNGEKWGGRSRGGRGVRMTSGNVKDIHVEGVTLQFVGKTLLNSSKLVLLQGHRYGLIGINGIGKSTLLRRLAKQSIPGVPLHLKSVYLQQELPELTNKTVREYLFESSTSSSLLNDLKTQEADLTLALENEVDSSIIEALAEKLCIISEEIDVIQSQAEKLLTDDTFIESHRSILRGLGIVKKDGNSELFNKQVRELSGGWRIRTALASALIEAKTANILLLDEPSNHLDLKTNKWLKEYLSEETSDLIVVLVSHDRLLLDSVCTDIIEMRDQQLHYFAGSYSDWISNTEEISTFHENRLDAQRRREEHLKKSGSDSQTKKKIERNAMHRGIDGKRFKNFSLKKLDESHVHLAETESGSISRLNRDQFKLPTPDIQSLRLATSSSPLISMDKCSLRWLKSESSHQASSTQPVLSNVTIDVCIGNRIAIVGLNGQGKSTLIEGILACIDSSFGVKESSDSALSQLRTTTNHKLSGKQPTTLKKPIELPTMRSTPLSNKSESMETRISRDGSLEITGRTFAHHNIRVGLLNQHHIDVMSTQLEKTCIEYLRSHAFGDFSELDARAHLGKFGLSGQVALNPIASLSGGQKARLALSVSCISSPHVLLLDEPTNHLSIEATEALASALQGFEGAVIVVSHNQWFLQEVCDRLLIVGGGTAYFVTELFADKSTKREKLSSKTASTSGVHTFSEILNSYINYQVS